ncbi:hypothetical protein ACJOV8_001260 [Formosa sp. 3Alg 14/1]|uniref:hypothetical protein n=1 Tax=Formosa sp. 3Alg 14/1 TaxID=3382190 RepID=UPI0039BE91FF
MPKLLKALKFGYFKIVIIKIYSIPMIQKYHQLVQKTKLELEKFDKKKNITWEEKRKFRGTCLPISVELKLRHRAFKFMNDLILCLEKNGHYITFKYDRCHIEMYGHLTEINLRQKYFRKRVKDATGYSSETYEKSMFLEFQVGSHARKGWLEKDSKKLKDYLNPIYDYIEKESLDFAESWKRRELEEEERQIQLKIEEDIAKQKQFVENNLNQLIASANNYKIANDIRIYINALVEKETNFENQNEFKNYLDWANSRADEIDPTIDFSVPKFK